MIQRLSIVQVILIRGVVQLVLILPYILTLRLDVRGPEGSRLLLWTGAFIITIQCGFELASVRNLPFGDAMAIHFSSPVIVMLLSHCFLKELCGIYKTFVVIMMFIGISLITKPMNIWTYFRFNRLSKRSDSVKNSKSCWSS